ncbi:DUF421 domain-containing protein [Larkinella soli]|uniref:DUF421 domain-containing protein n=1 Tax=Larkinella soli TaxID=1770527 RepID=UPI000FFCB451|nr:YetF domain-containing protein [Larkinella soli]
MKKEEIHFDDWKRILLGNNPPEFLIEVFFRSLLILLFFLVIVRLLGKRMNGQLTLTEMAVMLTLGAIISPIMQLPDRGILLGVMVLVCALSFQRQLTRLDFKSKRVEEITQGKESLLIEDGVLQLEAMERARISKQQLFAVLRSHKIFNVNKVERLYIEACGLFSIYTAEDEKPGLSAFPDTDPEVHSLQPAAAPAVVACMNCGNTEQMEDQKTPCPVCQEVEWTQAVC